MRSPCLKAILSFIPLSICWEWWKNRNCGQSEGSILPVQKLVENVQNSIVDVFSNAAFFAKRSPQDDVLLCC